MKLAAHLAGAAVCMALAAIWMRETYTPTFGITLFPILLFLGGFGWMVVASTAAWIRRRR